MARKKQSVEESAPINRNILVERLISEHGLDRTYVLYEGDKVKCLRCGKEITISPNTVGTDKDGFKYIKCNNELDAFDNIGIPIKVKCGYMCDAVRYVMSGTRI